MGPSPGSRGLIPIYQFGSTLRWKCASGERAVLGFADRLKLPVFFVLTPPEHLARGIPLVEAGLIAMARGEPGPGRNQLPAGVSRRLAAGCHSVTHDDPGAFRRLRHGKVLKVRTAREESAGVVMGVAEYRQASPKVR